MRAASPILVAIVLGCSSGSGGSGGSTGTASVTGAWCGIDVTTAADCVGDEVVYTEFVETGPTVTGMSCEDYLDDCFSIENGTFTNGALVFDYLFAPYRVDADLTAASDGGQILAGTYASTKCSCDVPVTLHKLD